MAELKDTIVQGDLVVTGEISSSNDKIVYIGDKKYTLSIDTNNNLIFTEKT